MAAPEAPALIGPYRVDGTLGAGGMGAVYRAWDARLERPVAVKRLLPRLADDDVARQRFRREARAAARLQHPAIVQIYDVVESAEGDWLVMELVEGERLSQRARGGSLEVAQALDLGRQVAEGLQEAHSRGIVHRDLKSDNVLVTATGRAKILDFGIARALDDAGLTGDGIVLGTSRAMSPEQATGQSVGPPSDVFSFGVLLYEALTGRSPFAAPSRVETLRRIVAWEPPPIRELRPELPAEVAALVERLLRKEPGQRPGAAEVAKLLTRHAAADPAPSTAADAETATAADLEIPTFVTPSLRSSTAHGSRRRRGLVLVLTALAVILVTITAVRLLRPRALPAIQVATPAPRVTTTGEAAAADLLADAVRLALLRTAAALDGIAALSPDLVDPVTPSLAAGSPVALARATAVDEVLPSSLDCDAATCRLFLHRVRADGTVAWAEEIELPLDDPRLADTAVGAALRRAYPERRAAPAAAPAISPADYQAFLRLRRRFLSGAAEADLEGLQAELEQLGRAAPAFPDVHLLAAEVAGRRFALGREPVALAQALEHVARARGSGADPRPLFLHAELALAAGDAAGAETLLDELAAAFPGDPEVLVRRAWLANLRGHGGEALALLEQAVERRPSWDHLFNLARFESEHGRFESARAHLDELLVIFPGHLRSRSMLAQLELMTGSVERAAELYEELAADTPRLPFLSNLGLAQLFLGRYGPAAESFRRAVAMAPANPVAALNLADAELLLGREAEAERLYRQTVTLAEADPAGGGWQMLTVKAQALAHLGHGKPAVAAVQEALRLAPDNPQAHHEAALVYALLGERMSALVSAEAALAAGLDRRWFDLPWFDDLRRDPELRRLLAASG